MKRLVVSPKALVDLEGIARFIAADNPARARSFVGELRAVMVEIAERPLTFRLRDEWSPGLRSARHGAYQILFRDHSSSVRITRVLHGARNIPALVGKRTKSSPARA